MSTVQVLIAVLMVLIIALSSCLIGVVIGTIKAQKDYKNLIENEQRKKWTLHRPESGCHVKD